MLSMVRDRRSVADPPTGGDGKKGEGMTAQIPTNAEQRAHHEAGHALMNLLQGFSVQRVSLEPPLTKTVSLPALEAVPLAERWRPTLRIIRTLYAGAVAEEICFGATDAANVGVDNYWIDLLANFYFPADRREVWLGKLRQETAELLRQPVNQQRVRTIAAALLQEDLLEEARLQELVGEVEASVEAWHDAVADG